MKKKKKRRVKEQIVEKTKSEEFFEALQTFKYFVHVTRRGSAIKAYFAKDTKGEEVMEGEEGEIIFGDSGEKINPDDFDCELGYIKKRR